MLELELGPAHSPPSRDLLALLCAFARVRDGYRAALSTEGRRSVAPGDRNESRRDHLERKVRETQGVFLLRKRGAHPHVSLRPDILQVVGQNDVCGIA